MIILTKCIFNNKLTWIMKKLRQNVYYGIQWSAQTEHCVACSPIIFVDDYFGYKDKEWFNIFFLNVELFLHSK